MSDPNRPPEQDSGNLLRDLRSLREAATPRPGVVLPKPPPPRQQGPPKRLVGVVLLMVVLVVGLAARNAGVFDSTHAVPITGSASASPGPNPSATVSSSATPSAPASAGTPAPIVAPGGSAAALPPDFLPFKAGLEYAIAAFLVRRYDPVVAPAERFSQDPNLELCAPSGGPAVWFARDMSKLPDELAIVSAAASPPCTAVDSSRRPAVADALAHLVQQPGSLAEKDLGEIVAGDPAKPLEKALQSALGDTAIPLALARALTGAPLPEIDKALENAKPIGWAEALRAHVAVMQGKRDDALQHLNQVNAGASEAGEVYLAAGLALRLGDEHLASGLLERVKVLAPRDSYQHYWLGLIAEKAGRKEEALTKYANAASSCADPRLIVAARVRRARMLQAEGQWDAGDNDWRAAEDYDPDGAGVLMAKAASVHAAAERAKGTDRMNAFAEALDRWQRLVIVMGPQEDIMMRLLACYLELKDQATAREGLQFFGLLVDQKFLADGRLKTQVVQLMDTLKDRVRPRQIWEAPPK